MKSDDYLKLEQTIGQLRHAVDIFAEATSDENCDKKGVGFNKDSRFSAFKTTVTFDSWRGYYGNSGCSTVIHFADVKAVEDAFDKYLNLHWSEIFRTMADMLEKEAQETKAKYIAELEAELARVKSTVNP